MIDHAEFWLSFSSKSFELKLPFENYAIEEAFEKAKKEWGGELMILVADMLLMTAWWQQQRLKLSQFKMESWQRHM